MFFTETIPILFYLFFGGLENITSAMLHDGTLGNNSYSKELGESFAEKLTR